MSSFPCHAYGHLGRSLACISSISHVTVISAANEGATYFKVIGKQSEVQFYDGIPLTATGTRVMCSKMFEGRRSLRQSQQSEFRIQHSKIVQFLGGYLHLSRVLMMFMHA